MTTQKRKMELVDWLDDLCVRFIINLPHEELQSVERICFQIEEAQWFYEDFIRPLDPSLPSMNLRTFAMRIFQHCPLSAGFSELHYAEAYQQFLEYKTRVPVRGAIMLNEDMTHAVLVKGWKKGAKWSFPRGKINKDESDLDCAIREVYEETGYDLRAANLVGPEDKVKSIAVNMREQSMLLFVFRGVPMDTHFEPRTRKEISKIDWYKLADLPTLKRRHQVQQGSGQDLVKDNSFYMVAPFLGPLKGWIKQQRRLDKQKAPTGSHLVPPAPAGVTDTELDADLGETTADEAPAPKARDDKQDFDELVAKLGRSHRASDALPEVSAEPQTEQILDPAAELKRLLSVGTSLSSEAHPVQSPQANPLLAILQGNSRPPPPVEPFPRTPFEQLMAPPQQPHSPHGQHHPRPPHLDHMPPPPSFPFHPQHQQHPHPQLPQHGPPFRGAPQYSQVPPPHNLPPGPPPPPPPPPAFLPSQSHFLNHGFPTHNSNIPQAFNEQASQPYQQTADLQFAQQPTFSGVHGPAIPEASKLPPPKLTAHTLSLLNAFKMNEKPADSIQLPPSQPAQSSQATPKMSAPPIVHRDYHSFVSPPSAGVYAPYAPSPPAFQSPPPNANFQPAQPKPRSAHQDSLLNLFRSPSVAAATPPPPKGLQEPAELSALPTTPGNMRTNPTAEVRPPLPDTNTNPNLLDTRVQQNKAGLTSATIHGPVNAPDFDTMKRNAHHSINGHSRGPSPAHNHHRVEQKTFIPQQILMREDSTSILKNPAAQSEAAAAPQAPFKPQILKRPQQTIGPAHAPDTAAHAKGLLDLFKSGASPSPQPVPSTSFPPPAATQAPFDRRDTLPTEQKNALLSLFNKPTQPLTASPTHVARSPFGPPSRIPSLPSKSPIMPTSPIPPARSPQPPTPKMLMSGVISPVSPLPLDKGSQQNSPAHLASRSRISSIGDAVVPPSFVASEAAVATSHPTELVDKGGVMANSEVGHNPGIMPVATGLAELGADRATKARADGSSKSPVDKTFLLGFLHDVARKGR